MCKKIITKPIIVPDKEHFIMCSNITHINSRLILNKTEATLVLIELMKFLNIEFSNTKKARDWSIIIPIYDTLVDLCRNKKLIDILMKISLEATRINANYKFEYELSKQWCVIVKTNSLELRNFIKYLI